MLDLYIIDDILKREEAQRREQEQRIEISIEMPREPLPSVQPAAPEEERGVAIIDI